MGFKRVVLIGVMVLLFSMSLVMAAAVTNSDFTLTLEEQSPDPVEPGEVVTLEFKVKNTGTESTGDVIVSIDPKHPFSLYESEASVNLGEMKNGEVVSSVEFRLLIDDSAAQGDAEVELFISEVGSSASIRHTLTVDIETRDAVLDITAVELDPKQVSPGDQFDLVVTLMNEADSLLQSIYATINTSEGQPVAAYLSSAEKVISSLSSGEAISLHYKLIVDPSIETGLYRMPFELNYEDRSGNSYSTVEYLSLIVSEEADLDVQLRSSEIWRGDRDGKVVFEIANRGLGELKSMQMNVLEGEGYSVISTQDSYYVGNIDSDDTETEEVVISTKRGNKEILVNVGLRYLDSVNTEFYEEFVVKVPVYSKGDAVELGITEAKSYGSSVIFLLIVIFGGYYWYKRKHPKFSLKAFVSGNLKRFKRKK
ncbi:hypothetical protein HOA92_06225 [archaeon]|jgi:hypothetical protein|nr:hypothetical protein [archaeon]MBT6762607.1 hypothetical protein [archaeon]